MYFFLSSRRRHTRLQGDWSSDVCSSDLLARVPSLAFLFFALVVWPVWVPLAVAAVEQIGRASCRERVYFSVVGVSFKKKTERKKKNQEHSDSRYTRHEAAFLFL